MSDESLDSLRAQALTGIFVAHGSSSDADCVIGFSFGFRKQGTNIQPGLSNQQLAGIVTKHYLSLPKILQFEIADALPRLSPQRQVFRIERHRRPDEYLDTREVAYQAKHIMDTHGWKTAVIVAHPRHIPRVDAVCRRLGIRTITADGLSGVEFDRKSEQKHTRNEINWATAEPKAIAQYAQRGWI